jgi:hypothetical protein
MNHERPDESQRIEDFDKARVMGDFENAYREKYIGRLKKELEQPYTPEIKRTLQTQIDRWEKKSNELADGVGALYDAEKEANTMSDDEVINMEDKVGQEMNAAENYLSEIKQAALDNPSERMLLELENAVQVDYEAQLKHEAWMQIRKDRKINTK